VLAKMKRLSCVRGLRLRKGRVHLRCASSQTVPERANVVVVGGGIIGTSVAYHLAKAGVEDVLLLERDRLTSGTTWHAAGLMNSFGSMSSTSTWSRQYTQELYRDILPTETGLETGYMGIGFIELACDADRLEAFRRIAAFNRFLGVDVAEISPEQVKDLFPLCETSDVLSGFWVENDGRANPTDATMALAKGARLHGANIIEQCHVAGVTTSKPNGNYRAKVTGVRLENETVIAANIVVNCAGMWARQFGEACGVYNIPNQAAEHYYLITEPMKEIDPSWPVIEDSSKCVYIRPEGKGLMLGFFEWEGAAWKPEGVPLDFSFGELDPDWDRMMPYVEQAMKRVPAAENVGVKALFCGPESFTPDNRPIVGESPELRNYYIAAGLNSIGILTGGGIGKILAQWIQQGCSPHDIDVTAIDASRFQRYQSNITYRNDRTGEALGNTYKVHYPDHQPTTCRNAKQSVLHERLVKANAFFQETSGWESPSWYAPHGTNPKVETESFGRENWFLHWEAEHISCRNNVALFDMSFMSKFHVQGNDAGKFLNRLSTANVDGDWGMITYTQWLDEQGYMAADLTITKMAENHFMVVATDTMLNKVYSHMLDRLVHGEHVFVTDVTGRYAQLNLQGPRSRELLQGLTSVDLNNFAFRRAEEIDIGLARVLCIRITYVGELGYELFVPVEQARHVYDCIVELGREFSLSHAGLKALGSLRMEKGYRDYGHDMDNTDRLLDCGLGFTCDFEKEGGFIGQKHVLAQKDAAKERGGLLKRIVNVLVLDPAPLLHHGEILWKDGRRISDIRAASYGHTVGGAVGLSMLTRDIPVKKDWLDGSDWEVEVGSRKHPCRLSIRPMYDPASVRVKDA
jgi:glycine cleavage system aminomethyltransferase T/glycine/D-amino acid oxidase-like deaminating enzyme